jgi:hypothetical protein
VKQFFSIPTVSICERPEDFLPPEYHEKPFHNPKALAIIKNNLKSNKRNSGSLQEQEEIRELVNYSATKEQNAV